MSTTAAEVIEQPDSQPSGQHEPRRLSRLSLDAATLGTIGTAVGTQVALVVSGVIVARLLGPADRGSLAFVVAISVAVSFLVALGLPTAVSMWAARDPHSAMQSMRTLRRWIGVQYLLGAVLTAVLVLLLYGGDSPSRVLAATLVPAATIAMISYRYTLGILQGWRKFLAFNSLRVIPVVVYALAVVAIALTGDATVGAFVVAWTVANVLAAVVTARAVRSRAKAFGGAPEADAEASSDELLKYGLKAQIGVASPLESFSLDQVVLGVIAGISPLGLYVVAAAFMNLPRFMAQGIGMVVFSRVAQSKSRAGGGGGATSRQLAAQAIFTTVALAGGTVIVLEATVGWLVPFFFGDAYSGAVPITRVLLLAAFCFSVRRVLGDILRGENVPAAASVAEVASWVIYAIAVVPLTLDGGAEGAALALTIAAAISAGIITWSTWQHFGRIAG